MGSKGEHSREQIVKTANRLFYAKGYSQTSFSDIVEASAMRRGNIYYYFKTKEDILDAVIAQRLTDIRTLLEGWDAEFPAARDRLKRFAAMILLSQDELLDWGCPMGTLNSELAKVQPDLQQHALAMFDLFRDWLSQQFRSLGKTKDQADRLALETLARGQGISMMTHIYRDITFLKRETRKLSAWFDTLVG